jgi:hypothetical protein
VARALLAILAVGLAACGGSDSDEEPPPPREDPARRQFIERLDAICKRANEIAAEGDARLAEAQTRARSSRQAARSIVRIIDDLLPRVRRLETELRRLEPPAGEQRFAASFLVQTEEINDLFAASREAAAQNDVQTFQALGERSKDVAAERSRLVRRHGGFEACGEGAP